jgi:GMP synthase-like glutamine amidotransferase
VKPVLLLKNDPVETFGVAPEVFAASDVEVLSVDAAGGEPLPPLPQIAGVVAFGSTAHVGQVTELPWISAVRDLTREAVDRRIPYLGICFGAQLLASALERPVFRAPAKEVGFEPLHPRDAARGDRLTSLFADGDMVFHWHEDTFELPEGAVLLATGDHVRHQAYRVADLAWGLQFHLEIDVTELEMWLDEADAAVDLKSTWGKSSDEIRSEAKVHMAAHEEKGREVLRRFADVVREASA